MENWKEELYHYGVVGMKWGVWNDETRARRTGSKLRARKTDEPWRRWREKDIKKLKKLDDKQLKARNVGRIDKADRYSARIKELAKRRTYDDMEFELGMFDPKNAPDDPDAKKLLDDDRFRVIRGFESAKARLRAGYDDDYIRARDKDYDTALKIIDEYASYMVSDLWDNNLK